MRISTRHVLSDISIHALRVEGDYMLTGTDDTAENFYPRPPGGGRQLLAMFYHLFYIISIHALRVEGDGQVSVTATVQKYFYPRPPGGGRLVCTMERCLRIYFYPRPPGGGRLHVDRHG